MERADEALVDGVGVLVLALLAQLRDVALDEVVGAVARLRLLVVDHRVVERVHVARRLPDGRVHEDGRVEALDVVVLVDHRAPPAVLNAALELDAERAVVVGRGEAAVDLRGLEEEAAALRKGDDGVEGVGHDRGVRDGGRRKMNRVLLKKTPRRGMSQNRWRKVRIGRGGNVVGRVRYRVPFTVQGYSLPCFAPPVLIVSAPGGSPLFELSPSLARGTA